MPRKTRYRNTGAGKGIKDQLNPALLLDLYCEQRLTQAEIARRFGCTPQFVSLLLREYDIKRKPRAGQIESGECYVD
ncbi:MAG: hypothetical protein ACR2GA_04565 [Chloroflexota bacterium]